MENFCLMSFRAIFMHKRCIQNKTSPIPFGHIFVSRAMEWMLKLLPAISSAPKIHLNLSIYIAQRASHLSLRPFCNHSEYFQAHFRALLPIQITQLNRLDLKTWTDSPNPGPLS